jgi:hypothetical protein
VLAGLKRRPHRVHLTALCFIIDETLTKRTNAVKRPVQSGLISGLWGGRYSRLAAGRSDHLADTDHLVRREMIHADPSPG